MLHALLRPIRRSPILTVGLPLYRNRKIAWLALESLVRQRDVDFPWELIVAEERKGALRERGVRAYEQELRRSGCVRIQYVGLKRWIPLCQKWRLIARNAHSASRVFVMHAGDCYSPPRRLRGTLDHFDDPSVDWVHTRRGLIYCLRSGRTILFDAGMEGFEYRWGFYKACRMALARELPVDDAKRNVDRWFLERLISIKGSDLSIADAGGWWRGGVETYGLNNITELESDAFTHPESPFRHDDENLIREVPPDILSRLEALSDERMADEGERRQRLIRNAHHHRGRQGT